MFMCIWLRYLFSHSAKKKKMEFACGKILLYIKNIVMYEVHLYPDIIKQCQPLIMLLKFICVSVQCLLALSKHIKKNVFYIIIGIGFIIFEAFV